MRSLECFETQDNLLLSNSGTLVLNTWICPTQQPFEPTLETEIHTGIYPTRGYTMLKGMPRNCGPPPLPSLQTISLDTLLVYRRLLVDVMGKPSFCCTPFTSQGGRCWPRSCGGTSPPAHPRPPVRRQQSSNRPCPTPPPSPLCISPHPPHRQGKRHTPIKYSCNIQMGVGVGS